MKTGSVSTHNTIFVWISKALLGTYAASILDNL